MNNKHSSVDYKDTVLVSGMEHPQWNESTLPQVVAAGRLFILNGNGEYEAVFYAQYIRDGEIRSVSDNGEEIDGDGTVMRWFQPSTRPPATPPTRKRGGE